MNIGRHRENTPKPLTVITIIGTPCSGRDGREYRVAEHAEAAIRFEYETEEDSSVKARTCDVVALVESFSNSKVFASYFEADLQAWRPGEFCDSIYVVQVVELETSWDALLIQARTTPGLTQRGD